MDTNELKRKLKSACPHGILDIQAFGRENVLAAWVEAGAIPAIARSIADPSALHLDWLENLSCFELEGALVLSYFLRSTSSKVQLVLRATFEILDPEAEIVAGTVTETWPMAEGWEQEIADLFGIRFSSPGTKKAAGRFVLPEAWVGFPLRKSYVFPAEFNQIPHLRPVGRTVPDEFGVVP